MKTIIAGSRGIRDYDLVKKAVVQSHFSISEIYSGGANGVDKMGEEYGRKNGIPVKVFPAKWEDFSAPCSVKINKFGRKYNAMAGYNRNRKMAETAEALIAIHNGSPGTQDMIEVARAKGLKVFEWFV